MALVLGVDSSTQSSKAVLVDADDGTVLGDAAAPHPPGTEVDPRAWLDACDAVTAPLLARADALAVGGQQHGLVALDRAGEPVRAALLWNDTRSAAAAEELVAEHGGPQRGAAAGGGVVVAFVTANQRRLREHHHAQPAPRERRVLPPHDQA